MSNLVLSIKFQQRNSWVEADPSFVPGEGMPGEQTRREEDEKRKDQPSACQALINPPKHKSTRFVDGSFRCQSKTGCSNRGASTTQAPELLAKGGHNPTVVTWTHTNGILKTNAIKRLSTNLKTQHTTK